MWAGTCSSTSVFLPFSVFVFVHTGWFILSIGDSTTSRDGQRTRGSVSCGHDVSGADHWLHRDGHVSDRHFSSAIHFNINTLGHMKVMRNIVFVGNTVLISLLVPIASTAQLIRVCMRIQQGLRFRTLLVLVLARCSFVFWCSCVGRQKHFHCRRKMLPMHGSVDQDADLDSTPDFDSSQAESSSQLAPNVTVGAKQFRYTEVSFQPGYRCNMKCVVYIRIELCNMSCCHVARPCSNGSISAWRRNRRRYPSSCCVSHISSYMFTAVLTMINRTWVAYLAIVHKPLALGACLLLRRSIGMDCSAYSCPEFDFLISSPGNSNNKGLLHSSRLASGENSMDVYEFS